MPASLKYLEQLEQHNIALQLILAIHLAIFFTHFSSLNVFVFCILCLAVVHVTFVMFYFLVLLFSLLLALSCWSSFLIVLFHMLLNSILMLCGVSCNHNSCLSFRFLYHSDNVTHIVVSDSIIVLV